MQQQRISKNTKSPSKESFKSTSFEGDFIYNESFLLSVYYQSMTDNGHIFYLDLLHTYTELVRLIAIDGVLLHGTRTTRGIT